MRRRRGARDRGRDGKDWRVARTPPLLLLLAVCLVALAARVAIAAEPESLYAAMVALNCTKMARLIDAAGLRPSFEDPRRQVAFLLPTNDAIQRGVPLGAGHLDPARVPGGWPLAGEALRALLDLHSLPLSAPGAHLRVEDGAVLRTLLPSAPGSRAGSLTFRVVASSLSMYAGGVAPGAYVDTHQSWAAGASRVYLVDRLLLPPDTGLVAPSTLPGLSMHAALWAMDPQVVGAWVHLVEADPDLLRYTRDVDLAATLLIPTNNAVQRLLARLKTTLDAFANSSDARRLVQAHILPDRPWHTKLLPPGASTLPSLDPQGGAVTAVVVASGGSAVLTLGGAGNVVPVTVERADVLAGKSVMHVISDVVLLSAALPTTSTAAAGPGDGPSAAAPSPPPIASSLPAVGSGGAPAGFAPANATAATPQGPSPPPPGSSAPVASPAASPPSTLPIATVGGIIGGALGGFVLLKCGLLVWWISHKRRKKRQEAAARRAKSSAYYMGSRWDHSAHHSTMSRGGGDASHAADGGRGGSARTTFEYQHQHQHQQHLHSAQAAPALPFALTRTAPAVGGAAQYATLAEGPQRVQGFIYGDPFVRETAPLYSWTDVAGHAAIPGVEAGINAEALDQLAGSPAVCLSRAEVVKHIRLLRTGLLGRGSSALVFKCQWPARFGPNALLAVKVLKDPYQADPSVYESFCYEAAVLATVKHPNVVRMFGYCLELPTACIIMELLPSTLKDKMYKRPPDGSHTASSGEPQPAAAGIDHHASAPPPPPPPLPPKPSPRPSDASDATAKRSADSRSSRASPATQGPNTPPISPGSVTPGSPLPLHSSGPLPQVPASARRSADPPATDHRLIVMPVSAEDQADTGGGGGGSPPRQPSTPPYHGGPLPPPPPAARPRTVLLPNDVARATAASPASGATSPAPNTTSAVTTSSSRQQRDARLQRRCLGLGEVLRVSVDVAAGLAYLHRRPAVASLPSHPTAVLDHAAEARGERAAPGAGGGLRPAVSVGSNVEEEEEAEQAKAVARIVHRDLKPSNILISTTGTAKISDFGLARWHNNTTVHTGKLGVGTLRYMAPELLLGHCSGDDSRSMTNKVDIYSLGMLMWEMASGQLPWSGLNEAQIIAAVISRQRPTLDGPPSEVPDPSIDLSSGSGLLALARALHGPAAGGEGAAGAGGAAALALELQGVITSCWQQKDFKRPTAHVVHKALATLLAQHAQHVGAQPASGA